MQKQKFRVGIAIREQFYSRTNDFQWHWACDTGAASLWVTCILYYSIVCQISIENLFTLCRWNVEICGYVRCMHAFEFNVFLRGDDFHSMRMPHRCDAQNHTNRMQMHFVLVHERACAHMNLLAKFYMEIADGAKNEKTNKEHGIFRWNFVLTFFNWSQRLTKRWAAAMRSVLAKRKEAAHTRLSTSPTNSIYHI